MSHYVTDQLHMTPARAKEDVRRKLASVQKQLAQIERQFFTGQPRLLGSGLFRIGANHYA